MFRSQLHRLSILSIAIGLLTVGLSPSAKADYINMNLGLAGPEYYAVLALAGASDIALNGPGTTQGNVGISSGTLSLNGSKGPEVNGNVILAGGANISIGNPPQVTGSVLTNQNLSLANTDALSAAAAFNALTPTQTVPGGGINGTTTINGSAGLNVLNISGINLGNGQTLTLNGPAGSEFIINDSGSLVLNSGKILLSGGVSNTDVVFNITSSGNQIQTSGGLNNESVINGIILAPNSGVAMAPGLINGELIAGGSTIHLVSGASVELPMTPPPSSVPTPPAIVMMVLGGLIFPFVKGHFPRRQSLVQPSN